MRISPSGGLPLSLNRDMLPWIVLVYQSGCNRVQLDSCCTTRVSSDSWIPTFEEGIVRSQDVFCGVGDARLHDEVSDTGVLPNQEIIFPGVAWSIDLFLERLPGHTILKEVPRCGNPCR